jgi:flavin reductase (DIM6/NTAB) family NADH-FMN oxidoreductase RutF
VAADSETTEVNWMSDNSGGVMSPEVVDGPLPATYKDVMAAVCTPVSVVTAIADARPHGTTVSAFTSLSLDPPMLLVSLDRDSDLLALIRATGRFGVNVLGSRQSELALTFARKGATKFDGVEWTCAQGVPRLRGVVGWLACQLTDLVEGGDHIIALGTVVAAEVVPGPPLTYHARAFGTHATLEAGAA